MVRQGLSFSPKTDVGTDLAESAHQTRQYLIECLQIAVLAVQTQIQGAHF